MWKPILEQSDPKGALGPGEVHIEVVNVVDDEPVPKIGEAGIEPPPMFEENVDDSFDRVADFEKDEEVEIPILVVQPKTLKIPQTGVEQKRKRIKMPGGTNRSPACSLV